MRRPTISIHLSAFAPVTGGVLATVGSDSSERRSPIVGWYRLGLRFAVLLLLTSLFTLVIQSAASADDGAVTDLGIRAGDMVHDAARGTVYVSVREGDDTYANSVIKIDPTTGSVKGEVFVGSDPTALAMSDNGQYLYVGLDGASKVIRVSLDTFTVSLEIPVPAVTNGPAFAYDIAALPGQPGSIAVARRNHGLSPFGEGVAIFDDAVMRPDTTPGHISENSILFGSADTLYGSDLCCSGEDFFVVDVGASGATRTSRSPGLGGGQLGALIGGRVFGSNGNVVDITGPDPALDGQLAITDGWGRSIAYASNSNTVYVGIQANPTRIDEFDTSTYVRLRSINVLAPMPIVLLVLDDSRMLMIGDDNRLRLVQIVGQINGTVSDRHTGEGIGGICVGVWPFGEPQTLISEVETSASGAFQILAPSGQYQVSYVDCERWDYAAEWYGTDTEILPVTVAGGGADASMALTTGSLTGLVDMSQGLWALSRPRTDWVFEFYFGNPGDFPFVGDWNCDGVDTPGMYRQSDGYVYLRNSNTQGIADIRFFFGNPGDVPLAGDFNGDGCDTVSIYRPSNQTFYIINKLGENDGGLGAADLAYVFGNPGDKPFVGDFDGDGIDTVGLHRETTGLVYFRNSHTQGNADNQYIFGDPGDKLVAGNFSGFWVETPAVYRSSDRTFYIRHTNTQGNADRWQLWDFTGPTWHPVAGVFGLPSDGFLSMESHNRIQRSE